jgi:hypothetical protein
MRCRRVIRRCHVGIERRCQFLSGDVAPRARDIHRHGQVSSTWKIIGIGLRMGIGCTADSIRESRRPPVDHSQSSPCFHKNTQKSARNLLQTRQLFTPWKVKIYFRENTGKVNE